MLRNAQAVLCHRKAEKEEILPIMDFFLLFVSPAILSGLLPGADSACFSD